MPRISSKIIIGERVSCKATALPKDIITLHLQQSNENLKNLRLYGLVVGALTGTRQKKIQIKFDNIGDGNLVVDVLAGNLRYEKQTSEVAEQSTVQIELSESSESSLDEEDYSSDISEVDLTTTPRWNEQPITIDQRAVNSTYNQPCKINIPSVSLASPYTIFSRYLPMNYIEQNIIHSINLLGRKNSNWVDVTINEYITWLGLWVLMSVVPVSDRRYYWRTQENTQPLLPFNFQRWMASLRDRKPQCIIATASTTVNADEVERVVKNNTGSEVVKFTRPKVFYEYSQAKGAVDINNQVRDNMTSFHDIMRGSSWQMQIFSFLLGVAEANAFLTYKKWHEEAYELSHFDFRRELAHKMLSRNYNTTENLQGKKRVKTSELLHNLVTFPKKGKRNGKTNYPQLR
ncbi:5246_t:CDS:2, partial [Scutellospora calospora]